MLCHTNYKQYNINNFYIPINELENDKYGNIKKFSTTFSLVTLGINIYIFL